MILEKILGSLPVRDNLGISRRNFVALETEVNAHETQINTLEAPPTCILKHSTNQSIANNTLTPLLFDTEIVDTNNMHTNATAERITCNKAGVYFVTAIVALSANGTGTRSIRLMVNGNNKAEIFQNPGNVGFGTGLSINALFNLGVGDYVTVAVYQNSGVALSSELLHDMPMFSAIKVG